MNSNNWRPLNHSVLREAHNRNELGNDAFKRGLFQQAIRYYSDAINICQTDPKFYCNRAKCYLVRGYCNDALEDCKAAAKIDGNYPRVYYREAECHLGLGNYFTALSSLNKLKAIQHSFQGISELESKIGDAENLEQKAKEALMNNNYDLAQQYIKELLETVTSCTRIKTMNIECLLHRGCFQDADLLRKDIQNDERDMDTKYVTALFAFYNDELKEAADVCKSILNLSPDCTKTLRLLQRIKKLDNISNEGKKSYTTMDYHSANQAYSHGLEMEPTNDKVNQRFRLNRAVVRLKLKDYKGAIEDCNEIIKNDSKRGKAYYTRGECYIKLGKKKEAIADFNESYLLDKREATKKRIKEIEDPNFKLETETRDASVGNNQKTSNATTANSQRPNKSKTKKLSVEELESELARMKLAGNNIYQILNIPNSATLQEAEKACNAGIKSFHPDCYNQNAKSKNLCEEIFKILKSVKVRLNAGTSK